MAEHNEIGAAGEQLASKYLRTKGYEILDRNWRHSKHELDIVARDGKYVVIVEVKTRSNDLYGQPEEAVKPGKRAKLIKAANAYIADLPGEITLRFDIISVILHPSGKPYIHHIEDAFYPTIHDRPQ